MFQKPLISISLLLRITASLACVLLLAASSSGQAYPGIKCVVDGSRQCRAQHTAPWRQGAIYFASKQAVDTFQSAVNAKLAGGQTPDAELILKANHQLILTGQRRQWRCPITGKPFSGKFRCSVAGIEVFCFDVQSEDKLSALPTTLDRAKLVFSNRQFDNIFVPVSKRKPDNPNAGSNQPISLADLSKLYP